MHPLQRRLLVQRRPWCLRAKNHWVPGLWGAAGDHTHSHLRIRSFSHHCCCSEICTRNSTVPYNNPVTRLVYCCSVLFCLGGVCREHWHPSSKGQWCSVELHTAHFSGGDLPLLHRLPWGASEVELHDQPGGPGARLCSVPLVHYGWVTLWHWESKYVTGSHCPYMDLSLLQVRQQCWCWELRLWKQPEPRPRQLPKLPKQQQRQQPAAVVLMLLQPAPTATKAPATGLSLKWTSSPVATRGR